MVLSTICETIEYFVLQDQRKPQRNIQIRTCTATMKTALLLCGVYVRDLFKIIKKRATLSSVSKSWKSSCYTHTTTKPIDKSSNCVGNITVYI